MFISLSLLCRQFTQLKCLCIMLIKGRVKETWKIHQRKPQSKIRKARMWHIYQRNYSALLFSLLKFIRSWFPSWAALLSSMVREHVQLSQWGFWNQNDIMFLSFLDSGSSDFQSFGQCLDISAEEGVHNFFLPNKPNLVEIKFRLYVTEQWNLFAVSSSCNHRKHWVNLGFEEMFIVRSSK